MDDFWTIWSKSAEAGLDRAYCRESGPTEAGSSAFMERSLLRIRGRRLGGRAVGRVNQSDVVDVQSAQYSVKSSPARVLLFRWRLKSVADVLKGIRMFGFTQSDLEALLSYWDAVCLYGPCGPICSLHPWDGWVHLTCTVFISGSLIHLMC